MHHLGHHGRGRHPHWFPWHGIFLVVLGGWWLLGETTGIPFDWSLLGPIAILLVGLAILVSRIGNRGSCWYCGRKMEGEGALPPSEPGREP